LPERVTKTKFLTYPLYLTIRDNSITNSDRDIVLVLNPTV
jgi:hypothetical protein